MKRGRMPLARWRSILRRLLSTMSAARDSPLEYRKGEKAMLRIGTPELLVVLVIVILVFGVGRISKVAGELGTGIREFRKGLRGEDDDQDPES